VVAPPPSPLPQAEVEAAIAAALEDAAARKLSGKEITPFLLARVAQATSGRAQAANLDLLENDARLAGRIAAELASAG
jgi:pseudouridine-5'-phosphate glycosidase